jgi:hypothetical protein
MHARMKGTDASQFHKGQGRLQFSTLSRGLDVTGELEGFVEFQKVGSYIYGMLAWPQKMFSFVKRSAVTSLSRVQHLMYLCKCVSKS